MTLLVVQFDVIPSYFHSIKPRKDSDAGLRELTSARPLHNPRNTAVTQNYAHFRDEKNIFIFHLPLFLSEPFFIYLYIYRYIIYIYKKRLLHALISTLRMPLQSQISSGRRQWQGSGTLSSWKMLHNQKEWTMSKSDNWNQIKYWFMCLFILIQTHEVSLDWTTGFSSVSDRFKSQKYHNVSQNYNVPITPKWDFSIGF